MTKIRSIFQLVSALFCFTDAYHLASSLFPVSSFHWCEHPDEIWGKLRWVSLERDESLHWSPQHDIPMVTNNYGSPNHILWCSIIGETVGGPVLGSMDVDPSKIPRMKSPGGSSMPRRNLRKLLSLTTNQNSVYSSSISIASRPYEERGVGRLSIFVGSANSRCLKISVQFDWKSTRFGFLHTK